MNEVVITGMGAVTPIGNNIEEFRSSLYAAKSGVGRITRFDPSGLSTQIAAEVKNVKSDLRDVKITYALIAAREAFNSAFNEKPKSANGALSIGLGLELFSMQDLIQKRGGNIPKFMNSNESLTFLNTPSDISAHLISEEFSFKNSPIINISACAASTDAIGNAFKKIRRGELDFALAGGADSMINLMGVAGFSRINAMSTKNDTPLKASSPFDKNRDGFVMGEGASFLVLENKEHALKRGAKILATLSGFGNSLDAYNLSDPHPEGLGAFKSMEKALLSANLTPNDISAINAHGTGTPKNDPAESKAIRTLLGDHYKNVPVVSTKSMIGHLISAAGATEIVASLICLNDNFLHPTLNLTEIDPECELCHVLEKPKHIEMQHILKNSCGFGGQNASIVISKHKE